MSGDKLFNPISNKNHNSDLPILAITQEYGAIPRDEIDYTVIVSDKSVESYKVVEIGDFIISLRTFQGGIEYSNYKGLCSPAYVVLRKKNNKDIDDFFKHYFKTDRLIKDLNKNIEGIRDGKMVSFKQFSEILLPRPRPEEQQKIADCFSSIDELITAQSQKLETLKAHKKGLMQQLFPAEGESIPKFRFPEFRNKGKWRKQKISTILSKTVIPVNVESEETYYEIGIRSHGKGIFHKDAVTGKILGNKRVFQVIENAFIVNIVFAWEQAVAVTSTAENGMVASHRFPMYRAKENKADVNFIKYIFLTNRGKDLLSIASPGGAGRNKTLGQKEFEKLELLLPEKVEEQTKIAQCLSSIDEQIANQTEKIDMLKAHKKGLMQQLFPNIND
jgi:type I restriction enzyme S subunit